MIKVLPSHIANMIAAGEVVGRPASVVKELMENAVDAGASSISVIVKDAGRTLVQVIDNGCGMSADEAVLCFERHATSKIATAEDLENISTFGFRGEALASIAAVAGITMKTRRKGDETASLVEIDGFPAEVRCSETSAPEGTGISVRNLFYNTPARRKFLKSDAVELKHIIEEFIHVALVKPEIAFSLESEGRTVYSLKKANGLKFRILDLLGSGVADNLVDISADTSVVEISGFIGQPDAARKTPGNQYFFVNGRFCRSPYLHKAVMNAFEEMTPPGTVPTYIICLKTDPHTIDVNIHPTKSEIKFEDESVIFQTLYACVRETLGRYCFGGGIDFDTEGRVEMPQLGQSFQAYHDFPSYGGGNQSGHYSPSAEPRQDYSVLFQPAAEPRRERPVLIKGGYIFTPAEGGVLVVNIRRATSRILFERYLRALEKNEHISCSTLFPVQVQVGAASMPLFEENAQMLHSLGFDIVRFGNDTVVVNGMPEGYETSEAAITEVIGNLIPILGEGHGGLEQMMRNAMAQKFSVLGAGYSVPVTTCQQAQKLIDSLFECDNSELTAGGKRICAILSDDEIEKMF